jgi:sugar/nucleoside kinase (ribokinase family)
LPLLDVAVAGELNLDLILYGLPEALPPERELLADNLMLTLGASSAIVTHNLAALGSRVGFVSCIGEDQLGQIALDRLSSGGVDVRAVRKLVGTQTGLSVILQRPEWRTILTYPGTIFDLKLEHIDLGYLASARHFHLSSFYLQRGLRPSVPQLFRELKESGLTISLDPNDDPDDAWADDLLDALQYVDVFLPNAREVCKISGQSTIEKAVSELSSRVPILVVKLGAEGALARRGKEEFRQAAVPVQPIDAVGAGDSFDAGFLHQFLRGASLPDCLAFANRTGALSTTRPGGTEAFRDRPYCESFLRQRLAE